ncbi:unnamed protein product, partial [Arctogadus glacialis]
MTRQQTNYGVDRGIRGNRDSRPCVAAGADGVGGRLTLISAGRWCRSLFVVGVGGSAIRVSSGISSILRRPLRCANLSTTLVNPNRHQHTPLPKAAVQAGSVLGGPPVCLFSSGSLGPLGCGPQMGGGGGAGRLLRSLTSIRGAISLEVPLLTALQGDPEHSCSGPTTLLAELQASSGASSSKDLSHPKASSHHCLISSTVATAEGATREPRSFPDDPDVTQAGLLICVETAPPRKARCWRAVGGRRPRRDELPKSPPHADGKPSQDPCIDQTLFRRGFNDPTNLMKTERADGGAGDRRPWSREDGTSSTLKIPAPPAPPTPPTTQSLLPAAHNSIPPSLC